MRYVVAAFAKLSCCSHVEVSHHRVLCVVKDGTSQNYNVFWAFSFITNIRWEQYLYHIYRLKWGEHLSPPLSHYQDPQSTPCMSEQFSTGYRRQ